MILPVRVVEMKEPASNGGLFLTTQTNPDEPRRTQISQWDARRTQLSQWDARRTQISQWDRKVPPILTDKRLKRSFLYEIFKVPQGKPVQMVTAASSALILFTAACSFARVRSPAKAFPTL